MNVHRYYFQYIFWGSLNCILFLFIMCGVSHDKDIVVKGSLSNLPDGEVSLLDDHRSVITTTKSSAGEFVLKLPKVDYPEPVFVQLEHLSEDGVKRVFQFKTYTHYRGGDRQSQYFMLEDGIFITGRLKEFVPVNITIGEKYKLVYPDTLIGLGRQARVMFSDTLNYQKGINFTNMKNVIRDNSYSFYYLIRLSKIASDLSDSEFFSILSLFDKNVRESRTAAGVINYVKNRSKKKLNFETKLINPDGKDEAVLRKDAKLHMVVLWASWCGPCRSEIPAIKRLRGQFEKEVLDIVSVSLDQDNSAWQKAIRKEDMPWLQLIMNEESQVYAKEMFTYDGSIPTTLFINDRGEVIEKFVGYDELSEAKYEDVIRKNLLK